jgi:hypothetical protein
METWRVFDEELAPMRGKPSPFVEAMASSASGAFPADETTDGCAEADGPTGLAQATSDDTTINTSSGFHVRRIKTS